MAPTKPLPYQRIVVALLVLCMIAYGMFIFTAFSSTKENKEIVVETSEPPKPSPEEVCETRLREQENQLKQIQEINLRSREEDVRQEMKNRCDELMTIPVVVPTKAPIIDVSAATDGNHLMNAKIYQQREIQQRRDASIVFIKKVPSFELVAVDKEGEERVLIHNRFVSTSVEYDLIILIPSLARYNHSAEHGFSGPPMEYLKNVVEEYSRQLKDLTVKKKILIIVHAFEDEKYHQIFYETQQEYWQQDEFIFMVPPVRFTDPYSDIPNIVYASPTNPYPSRIARQQTCDVLLMTKFVLNTFKFKYLMYSEDDFVPCPSMLENLFKTLSSIENYHQSSAVDRERGFCSLKLTIGLGGSILTPSVAEMFLNYAKDNIDLNPVDILIDFILYFRGDGYKTCITEGLTSYISHLSNLTHIGEVSNWKERNDKTVFGDRNFHCAHNLNLEWHLGKSLGLAEQQRSCKNDIPLRPCV